MQNTPGNPGPDRTRHRGRSKIVVTTAFVLLGLGVTLFLMLAILVHRANGILRARVINTLSTRFQGRVELPEFHVSVWRGFEAEGKGLKIYPDALDQPVPLFAVGQFRFHTMWWNLLRSPMHVGDVTVSDLAINMPPKDQRKNIPHGPPPGETAKKRKIEIVVDRMEIDRAKLVLGTDKPGKDPMLFDIHDLKLRTIGKNLPMRFHAILVNPKPIGNIDSTGYFGPFNASDAGASPVQGEYTFTHADLNTIKGIGGMLSSTGRYTGELDRIVVDGTTNTPNFSIDISGHPVPLRTRFHAIVDGTDGDTYLQPVDAWLRNSHIIARGSVETIKGKGHHVKLDVTVGDHADIGDMLELAMKTSPPLMRGPLTMQMKLDLPPGKQHVAGRLHLKGNFKIRNAMFSNPAFQEKVDQLSLRGSGKAEDAVALGKASSKEKGTKAAPVPKIGSDMHGNFTLGDARVAISDLKYDVPGADIGMQGVYSMDGNQFDFYGKVRMKAHVSQMVTGWWKKMLLKPIDPIFAKNGAGTEVPIKVTGTRGSPKFGLDLGGHHGKDKAAKQEGAVK